MVAIAVLGVGAAAAGNILVGDNQPETATSNASGVEATDPTAATPPSTTAPSPTEAAEPSPSVVQTSAEAAGAPPGTTPKVVAARLTTIPMNKPVDCTAPVLVYTDAWVTVANVPAQTRVKWHTTLGRQIESGLRTTSPNQTTFRSRSTFTLSNPTTSTYTFKLTVTRPNLVQGGTATLELTCASATTPDPPASTPPS
ncbi:hypothetical protein [Cryptosporangium minutisporangium]|uniref:hypothetical protein n=1 Tax=Cryptosporangium minutisporangium TaxID=113569 RepID=UPI0031EACB9A